MSKEHKSIAGLRILVVEDESLTAEAIGEQLHEAGCQVIAIIDNARAAIEVAVATRPDLILMDIRLKGDMDGIQAAQVIRQRVDAPVVYLTAHSDQATLERAKATSAFGFVLKPYNVEGLFVAIDLAIDRFRLEQRLEENRLTYGTILSSISDGVIATDVYGRVQFMNSVAERMTGWPIGESQGQPANVVLKFADADDHPSRQHPIAHVLSTQKAVRLDGDERVVSRHGPRVRVEGGVAPVIDSLKRLVGTAITLHDVTDARKAEADLKTMAELIRRG
jgi:PAS domain S-box-containing protein